MSNSRSAGAKPDHTTNVDDWREVVQLMRQPVATLGSDRANLPRLFLRGVAAHQLFALQLRELLGLSANELHAVLALWEGGRCAMSELGRRIVLKPASVTNLCDRLERRDLIRRAPSPDDRRRLLVEVTPVADHALMHALEAIQGDIDSWAPVEEEHGPRSECFARLYDLARGATVTAQASVVTRAKSAEQAVSQARPELDPHW